MSGKVSVFVGPGGVGKTTLAAASALLAAEEGKKVLVLTIDPSKRLASTLGIEGKTEATKVPGFEGAGELWASVVDHRKTFDEFVRKAANRAPGAEKILKNHLYRQLTTTLSGSQDFSALERLYSSYVEGEYDLIVLDTPPAQHALTFLEAPAKIAALFNEGIARWFRDPKSEDTGFFQKIVGAGTRQVLKILESLTGAEFIRELADFFRSIEGWQDRLRERTSAVHQLLVSDRTEFSLVTNFDRAKLLESEAFARDIRRGGYRLKTVLINRAFPQWFDANETGPSSGPYKDLYEKFREFYGHREKTIGDFSLRLKGEVQVLQLPELTERVYDLEGLRKVARILKKGGWS